jgi:hypothetical protein
MTHGMQRATRDVLNCPAVSNAASLGLGASRIAALQAPPSLQLMRGGRPLLGYRRDRAVGTGWHAHGCTQARAACAGLRAPRGSAACHAARPRRALRSMLGRVLSRSRPRVGRCATSSECRTWASSRVCRTMRGVCPTRQHEQAENRVNPMAWCTLYATRPVARCIPRGLLHGVYHNACCSVFTARARGEPREPHAADRRAHRRALRV